MSLKRIVLAGLICLSPVISHSASTAVDEMMSMYRAQGAATASVENGQRLWTTEFEGTGQFKTRSCATCHTDNLKNIGKHVRTGKAIDPLAPSVNSNSLTDAGNIQKWFKRNCKWTLGRECSTQEKMDLLEFMRQQ